VKKFFFTNEFDFLKYTSRKAGKHGVCVHILILHTDKNKPESEGEKTKATFFSDMYEAPAAVHAYLCR
jgi:hypothetical protein